ncbi:MAG: phage terminase small subunit P27 family [Lachnospiraceae bacterium]|nr:phage terminase small subunit P27 family [Lachnospiraceae bacterium]
MAYIKPAAFRRGKTGKAEKEAREKAEESMKPKNEIQKTAPKNLSKTGKKLYLEIIKILPDGFLSDGDKYAVGVVAEALDRMRECQQEINRQGMFNEGGEERSAVRTYERYSKIFAKFGGAIGLSPKDRAALAVLNINSDDVKNDPLLKALRGD